MTRIALNCGEKIVNDKIELIIESVIGDGASCLVYSAFYTDHAGLSHSALLKECYPYSDAVIRNGTELSWNSEEERKRSLSSFRTAYEKLMVMQNTAKLRVSTARAFDLFEANGTLYSVTDVTDGNTFDKDKPESLVDILKTGLAISKVIQKYHNNGYLHLDIKPSNFLVLHETRELVVLFDMDSVTSMDDIKSGEIKCVSYSEGWASPEQMQGQFTKLCPATDIYSIGAVLFEKIIGRNVEPADTGLFADWDFAGKLFDRVNPGIKRLLRDIFHKTLAANMKRRYQSADELIVALKEAIEVAEQKQYLISDDIISDVRFVGRENDLQRINTLFADKTKAVFVHGFGGVGKTALVRKYAEICGKQFDCVKFCRYSTDLADIIEKLEIANEGKKNKEEHRKNLKDVLSDTRALLIIDNFDVETDDDLEYLLQLNCNILFTTRNDYSHYVSSEKIEIIELEELPADDLVQIFKNEYGKDMTAEEESIVKEIIEHFGSLTFIVPIIAKQIIASRIGIAEFASSVEDDIFSRFNEENEDVRIIKDGKFLRTNSLDYLRVMFNIAGLPEEHKTVLRYLYLLRYHKELTISEYRKYTGTKNLNVLNDLAFRNWITIEESGSTEKAIISVHQLIYDLVKKDFYPTYESVPGIAKYIENCFDTLGKMLVPGLLICDANIDWDKAKCITFALLMYDDIRQTEHQDTMIKKMTTLFLFMCGAFSDSPHKLYDLLFKSPEESRYRFYVHGIMDMFSFDMVKNLLVWIDYLDLLKSNVKADGKLSYSNIEFSSEEAKEEFIETVRNETGLSYDKVFSDQFVNIPYFVMLFYFSILDENPDTAKKALKTIIALEDIVREGCELSSDDKASEYNVESALIRLDYYQAICKYPTLEEKSGNKFVEGIDVSSYYEYYVFVLKTIQHVLSMELEMHLRESYLKKAESLIVLIEEQNERFTWYGLSEKEIMNYNPPTLENYSENQKLHWSKKADIWYDLVEKTLKKTEDPYSVYKLLLTFDYQTKALSNAKINKLLKANFIDMIYNDTRISAEQKQALLVNHVILQIQSFKFSRKLAQAISKKHIPIRHLLPILHLFFEAMNKAIILLPEFEEHVLSNKTALILDCAFILQKLLKKEVINTREYIEKCISLDNIDFVGELIYFADKIRMNGYIQKSQELKNKIMDLCLQVNLSELPEITIQMIHYIIRPIAVNYKRSDVLEKIDELEMTVARKYHLGLLECSHNFFLKTEKIAMNFLNDYFDAVTIEVYNNYHHHKLSPVYVDEMEKALRSHLNSINIYNLGPDYLEFEDILDEDYFRCINPILLSEFYGFDKKKVRIGICYLLAMSFSTNTYSSKFIYDALMHVSETEDYNMTKEEILFIADNILKICPDAKEDIDRYFNN